MKYGSLLPGPLLLCALVLALGGCAPSADKSVAASPKSDPPPSSAVPGVGSKQPAAVGGPQTPAAPLKHDPVADFMKGQIARTNSGLQNMVPAPAKTQSWTSTLDKPDMLAKAADEALHQLALAHGSFRTEVVLADGRGLSNGDIWIRDNRTFKAEFANITERPEPNVTKEQVISNGRKLAIDSGVSGRVLQTSLASFASEGNTNLPNWMTGFPRTILSGIAGGTPLEHLLADAKKAGFTVISEERTVADPKGSRRFVQDRILISRPDAAAKTQGAASTEILLDHDKKLPLTIRTQEEPVQGKPIHIMWTVKWETTADPKNLPDSLFFVPAPNKGRSTSRKFGV